MDKYKLFRTFEEEHEKALLSRKLKDEDKDDYYSLIREEHDKGNRQIILTNDIILGVTLKYILKEKYDLVDITTTNNELNERLSLHIDRAKKDRGYIAAVMLELKKREYRYDDIISLTMQKYDEKVVFYGNGVVSTNTILSEKLLNAIAKIYLGYN